ncbi:hypothetical protein V6C20_04890 [Caldibacillus thermoamylovorans]
MSIFHLKSATRSRLVTKNQVFHPNTTTRIGLVAKKSRFSPKYDDENRSRRQKQAFFTLKRRRERISSI